MGVRGEKKKKEGEGGRGRGEGMKGGERVREEKGEKGRVHIGGERERPE